MENEIYEEILDFSYVLKDKIEYKLGQINEEYPAEKGWTVEVLNVTENKDGQTVTITVKVTKDRTKEIGRSM